VWRVARLSAQGKVERDARIAADRARGLTWPTICERHAISERQAREVVKAHRPSLVAGVDPVAEVGDLLARYDAIVEELAVLAEATVHDGVRLGAINGRLRAIEARASVAQAVGLLPHLELVKRELDSRRMARDLLAIFERYGAPAEAVDELLELWRRPRIFAVPDDLEPAGAEVEPPAAGGGRFAARAREAG
jgi:hypothetical protein